MSTISARIKWSILSFKFLLLPLLLAGQEEFTKIYTSEIEVDPETTVYAHRPCHMPVNMHGTMTMDDTESAFTIRGKGEEPALIVRKTLEVKTWEHNRVKHEVTIRAQLQDQKQIDQFSTLVQNNLSLSADGIVHVDANMNIKTFRLRNGLFMNDKCWIELDDGTQIDLTQLEIKNQLYIPYSSNFKVEGEYVDLSLGPIEGKLTASISHGSISAENVKQIDLHVISSQIHLGQVDTAYINARSCNISGKRIENLTLDNRPAKILSDPLFDLDFNDAYTSSLNKYYLDEVGTIEVAASENDKFTMNQIRQVKIHQAIFSTFIIQYLHDRLFMHSKSSDVTIEKIDPNFTGIDIDNQLSTIKIKLSDLDRYELEIVKVEHTEFAPPRQAALISPENHAKKTYRRGDENGGKITLSCSKCDLILN